MSYQLLSETERTARKEYRCIWCPEMILKGDKHVHEASKYEGHFQDFRWHLECKQAANKWFRKYGEECFSEHEFKRGTDECA